MNQATTTLTRTGFEPAGWFLPLLQDRTEWVTGEQFGSEAGIFAVVVNVVLITVLWRWKGSSNRGVAVPTR